jgi:hypothetical protein
VLVEKHDLAETWVQWREEASVLEGLVAFLREAPSDRVQGLVEEIVATEPDLHDRAVDQWGNGAGPYRSRWEDLLRCFALDGYAVSKGRLTAVEPDLEGAGHVEDTLAAEIRRSLLPGTEGIIALLEKSADAFRQVPPDYNSCLVNVRAALQTLATEIGRARQKTNGGSFQADKWGQVLDYLRTSGLITTVEEALVSAVYTVLSSGAHQHVGLSQEEMVRLGRGMAISVSYFLVKLHNG